MSYLMLGAAAVGALASINQGQSAAAASKYNSEVEANNATQATQAAAAQSTDQQYQASRLISSQKATAGAAGVDPSQGSPLALMSDTAQRTTLDALRIHYGGQTAAAGYMAQSQLSAYQAGQYQTGGLLTAGAKILTGAAMFGASQKLNASPYSGGASGYNVSPGAWSAWTGS